MKTDKQLIRAKLLRQLLIRKVSDIIGVEKTLELLKECKKDYYLVSKTKDEVKFKIDRK
jgi:hypothetical protein